MRSPLLPAVERFLQLAWAGAQRQALARAALGFGPATLPPLASPPAPAAEPGLPEPDLPAIEAGSTGRRAVAELARLQVVRLAALLGSEPSLAFAKDAEVEPLAAGSVSYLDAAPAGSPPESAGSLRAVAGRPAAGPDRPPHPANLVATAGSELRPAAAAAAGGRGLRLANPGVVVGSPASLGVLAWAEPRLGPETVARDQPSGAAAGGEKGFSSEAAAAGEQRFSPETVAGGEPRFSPEAAAEGEPRFSPETVAGSEPRFSPARGEPRFSPETVAGGTPRYSPAGGEQHFSPETVAVSEPRPTSLEALTKGPSPEVTGAIAAWTSAVAHASIPATSPLAPVHPAWAAAPTPGAQPPPVTHSPQSLAQSHGTILQGAPAPPTVLLSPGPWAIAPPGAPLSPSQSFTLTTPAAEGPLPTQAAQAAPALTTAQLRALIAEILLTDALRHGLFLQEG